MIREDFFIVMMCMLFFCIGSFLFCEVRKVKIGFGVAILIIYVIQFIMNIVY